MPTTAKEHLAWCVERAMDYADRVREVAEHGQAERPYRCMGCGKTSRIVAHRPGCEVAEAFDDERAAVSGE